MIDESRKGQFEDLDPVRGERSTRREVWLALLVLGPLLLFGLWDWAHQQARADSYRQGVAAVAARHWEAARDAFTGASGYANAPDRARAAADQAQALARAYAHLQTAGAAGQWLAAGQAARLIRGIQPDYRDVVARQAAIDDAEFGRGLQGTIYLQTGVGLPGLYRLGPDGSPSYLPGSTATSRVYALSADGGTFLYDVDPLQMAQDAAICEPGAERQQQAAHPLRVALATATGAGVPVPLLLPDLFDTGSSYWLGAGAVWSMNAQGRIARYLTAGADAGRVWTAGPPPGTRLLASGPGSAGLVLATTLPDAGGAPRTEIARRVPGQAPTRQATIPGFVLDTHLSLDGRYATLLAEEAADGITRTLYLLDLAAGPRPPAVLDRIAWRGVILAAQLRATFVPGSPTTALLVEHQDDSGATIARYDLATGDRTVLWRNEDAIQRDERSSVSTDGQAIAFRAQVANRPYLVWLPLAAGGTGDTVPIASFGAQLVDTWFAPHSDFVVFRLHNQDGINKGTTEDVWSVPAPPAPGTTPQLLATARRLYDPAFPSLALPPTGQVALYIAPDASLRARTLDGAAEKTLAGAVEAVWVAGATP